jgi:hypothetical protein
VYIRVEIGFLQLLLLLQRTYHGDENGRKRIGIDDSDVGGDGGGRRWYVDVLDDRDGCDMEWKLSVLWNRFEIDEFDYDLRNDADEGHDDRSILPLVLPLTVNVMLVHMESEMEMGPCQDRIRTMTRKVSLTQQEWMM